MSLLSLATNPALVTLLVGAAAVASLQPTRELELVSADPLHIQHFHTLRYARLLSFFKKYDWGIEF